MSTDITYTTSKVKSFVKKYYENMYLSDQIKEIDDSKINVHMNDA